MFIRLSYKFMVITGTILYQKFLCLEIKKKHKKKIQLTKDKRNTKRNWAIEMLKSLSNATPPYFLAAIWLGLIFCQVFAPFPHHFPPFSFILLRHLQNLQQVQPISRRRFSFLFYFNLFALFFVLLHSPKWRGVIL